MYGRLLWSNSNNRRKNVLRLLHLDGAVYVAVAVVKTYALGGQRVAVRSDGEVNWLHSDHLSSVGSTTDQNGKVVGRQLFEPYGAVRAEFGAVEGTWGWATHRKAESHGLTFMRARWYSAGVGRFVQADTVVGGFGTNDWEDPSEWKGWVKAYKGWDDKQWQDFLDAVFTRSVLPNDTHP